VSTAQLGYVRFPKLGRLSPPANSTLFIPDSAVEGISYLDVRPFKKILIEIDADQPIDISVQNTPSGDAADFRDLAGYYLPSTQFDVTKRNTIAIDGADACVGFIRLKITTGSTAPSAIVVWVETKD
jgi:hypothetical protein